MTINLSTGVIGKDISGPAACIRRVKPEIAASNAGTLNSLKLKDDGQWAWPPMVFDNPVAKVQQVLDVMAETGTHPEFECFDVGIVRSVAMYLKAGMVKSPPGAATAAGLAGPAALASHSRARRRLLGAGSDLPETALPDPGAALSAGGVPELNLVMGVASGMPCDAGLLALLPRWMPAGAVWQATPIGRAEIWPVHQRVAELGGMLRTGLEDTFYLPDGTRAARNGVLIQALARCARQAGRAVASPDEARARLGLAAA